LAPSFSPVLNSSKSNLPSLSASNFIKNDDNLIDDEDLDYYLDELQKMAE
jgi:hypothetical protein